MLLVVDVGNTNTVLGVFRGEELAGSWRITTQLRTSDELGVFLISLMGSKRWGASDISGVIVSSVAPYLDHLWDEAIDRYIGVKPLYVSSKLDLGMEVGYGAPLEVGADRLVNAVAGVKKYGKPLILVDLGTAITLDVVDERGVYLGGAIAPGLLVSMESLFSRTAKLPQVTLEAPGCAIGRTTMESIRSGIIYGYAGLIDGLAERMFAELGGRCPVVATGGHAAVLAEHSRVIDNVEASLTLYGLRIIYERNS